MTRLANHFVRYLEVPLQTATLSGVRPDDKRCFPSRYYRIWALCAELLRRPSSACLAREVALITEQVIALLVVTLIARARRLNWVFSTEILFLKAGGAFERAWPCARFT